MLKCQPE
jgi:hypothetical protein